MPSITYKGKSLPEDQPPDDNASGNGQAIRALEGVLTLLAWQRMLIEDTLQQLQAGSFDGSVAGQGGKRHGGAEGGDARCERGVDTETEGEANPPGHTRPMP